MYINYQLSALTTIKHWQRRSDLTTKQQMQASLHSIQTYLNFMQQHEPSQALNQAIRTCYRLQSSYESTQWPQTMAQLIEDYQSLDHHA